MQTRSANTHPARQPHSLAISRDPEMISHATMRTIHRKNTHHAMPCTAWPAAGWQIILGGQAHKPDTYRTFHRLISNMSSVVSVTFASHVAPSHHTTKHQTRVSDEACHHQNHGLEQLSLCTCAIRADRSSRIAICSPSVGSTNCNQVVMCVNCHESLVWVTLRLSVSNVLQHAAD